VCLLAAVCFAAVSPDKPQPGEELARSSETTGHYGGHVTIGGRAEPKTLNPVMATDAVSREVTGRLMADLIDINRATQQTEPALAKTWKISPDGKTLAFVASGTEGTHVWVRPLDGPAARPLAGTEGATFPFWSMTTR
jgi:ABC-type transport system substrate-binding protein